MKRIFLACFFFLPIFVLFLYCGKSNWHHYRIFISLAIFFFHLYALSLLFFSLRLSFISTVQSSQFISDISSMSSIDVVQSNQINFKVFKRNIVRFDPLSSKHTLIRPWLNGILKENTHVKTLANHRCYSDIRQLILMSMYLFTFTSS